MKIKTLMVFSLLFSALTANAQGESKKILMIVNEGFQPQEYYAPRKIFQAEGFVIQTASRFGGVIHPGKAYPNIPAVQADFSFEQVKVSQYDAITFTGGGGAWSDYFPDRRLHKILKEAISDPNRVVALICAATGLLATADNLDGQSPQYKNRHVTGYPDVEGLLRLVGKVRYDGGTPGEPYVVTDGNLVTGRDPISAEQFGKTVSKILKGK